MPRKKVATILFGGEYMDLYDDGCIGRHGPCLFGPSGEWKVTPSGEWKVTGAVTRNNFGGVTCQFSLAEILADPGAIPWHHANGKQKTFITDLDNGAPHEWKSPKHEVFLI